TDRLSQRSCRFRPTSTTTSGRWGWRPSRVPPLRAASCTGPSPPSSGRGRSPAHVSRGTSAEVYCFDTDILAAALLREPPMQLVRRLARVPGDERWTTGASLPEIAYAAARNGDKELAGRVRDLIAAASTVLPFDHDAAETYAVLRMQLERLGVRLDESSMRIAAIAVSRDLTLVTASARLYDRRPGLRIEHWVSARATTC